MKKNILRIILGLLLCGTFGIIFGFSSQDAEESGGVSKTVTEAILTISPKYGEKSQDEKENILLSTEKVVRKIAHFSIYTLVGFLLMAFFSTYDLEERKRIFISLVLGMIYASSDEIHQSFIPGRSPQVTDVMIDSLGVLCGILILMLILQIIMIKRKRQTS